MEKQLPVIHDKVGKVFLNYVLPNILGMLAATSAGIIDGIFLGQFVGSGALSAVNIAIPFFSLSFGLVIMLATGGSVVCGKFLGQNNPQKASSVFSQIFFSLLVFALLITTICLLKIDLLVRLLGANAQIAQDVKSYLTIVLAFYPLMVPGFSLIFFAKVNGHPRLTSISLFVHAGVNIILDWLLVGVFGFGIKGAAFATGIAESVFLLVLFPSFFSSNTILVLAKPLHEIKTILHCSIKGFSQFLNESSSGVLILVFNMILIKSQGVAGVAAFTIINYLFFIQIMICYSITDAMMAPTSINFGAGEFSRTLAFLKLSILVNLVFGVVFSFLLFFFPEVLIGIFLNNSQIETYQTAITFSKIVWSAFTILGVNFTISAYFTAMHKPKQAVVISTLRALFLPIPLAIVFSLLYSTKTIFYAFPIAEFTTFVIAIWMLAKTDFRANQKENSSAKS